MIDHGGVVADVSDLSEPENRFERDFGELLEVYTRIDTTRKVRHAAAVRDLSAGLEHRRSPARADLDVPADPGGHVAGAGAVDGAHRVDPGAAGTSEPAGARTADAARARLVRTRATPIAGDLHDGPVQEMAGLAMRLSAEAELVDDPDAGITLRSSASAVRGSVRMLRSAIVGIYPPNLQQAGLPAALSDLVAGLDRHGIELSLEVEPDADFGADVDALLYRATQEALRNVEEHADARHVRVAIARRDGRAVLEVADDAAGSPRRPRSSAARGHMGLAILADMVSDAGGTLTVEPGAEAGTVVRVEVQAP